MTRNILEELEVEKSELDEKIGKLNDWLRMNGGAEKTNLDIAYLFWMDEQAKAMTEYSFALERRIYILNEKQKKENDQ